MKKFTLTLKVAGLTLLLFLGTLTSCNKDDEPKLEPEVTAVFSFTASGATVNFQNASVNADTYAWDFGDGVGTSTEENPVYEYKAADTYEVTLTASNADNSNATTISVTIQSTIALTIAGKTWVPVRSDYLAVALGAQGNDAGWDYTAAAGSDFSVGNLDGATNKLMDRISMANDEYTFNSNGTYNVEYNGDFWAENGIWAGTGYDNTHIEIVGGSLPLNTNGDDVSAFVSGTWDWSVDEEAKTLTVSGAGAHIINPLLKNEISTVDAGTGITYQVEKAESGADVDILVLYIETHLHTFTADIREYHVLASYHSTAPPIDPPIEPTSYATAVSAADFSHTFVGEAGAGSGISSVGDGSTYDLDYDANIGGEDCTKITKDATSEDTWTSLMIRAGADVNSRSEINFSGGETVLSIDVYFPSNNDYTGALTQTVNLMLGNESQYPGGDFFGHLVQKTEENIAIDTWVTLTFDFTDELVDAQAENPTNSLDALAIAFGSLGHQDGGDFYMKDLKLINP